jgi:hypothetical protein
MVARIPTFCPFCQSPNPIIEMDEKDYTDFRQGRKSALQIMGGSREKAEWIITGACSPCWDRLFKEAEGEE